MMADEGRRKFMIADVTILLLVVVVLVFVGATITLSLAPPMNIPRKADPIAAQTLVATWFTYRATVIGISIATVAAAFALYDIFRNTAQVQEFYQRPKFTVSAYAEASLVSPTQGHIGFVISNKGERGVSGFMLDALIPIAVFDDTDDFNTGTKTVDGVEYTELFFTFSKPLYPFGPIVMRQTNRLHIRDDVDSFNIRWCVYDMRGRYPDQITWGKTHVEVFRVKVLTEPPQEL